MATKAGLYAEDRGYQGDIRPVRRVNEPRKRGRRNGGHCVRAGVRLTAALDQSRSFDQPARTSATGRGCRRKGTSGSPALRPNPSRPV